MKENQIKEGDTIYLKTIEGSNAARRSDINKIKEVIVTKVGKKYLEAGSYKFHIDSLIQYSTIAADYQAYLSKEELENELETNRLYKLVKNKFQNFYVPELQEISKILKLT